ncbi:MAG: hypothetical protein KDB27_02140 [Planctomycetales bacterium]|nr:hypothetical protein [Planctomycetales bacterium]
MTPSRILVADDSPSQLEYLCDVVRNYLPHWEIVPAHNYDSAVKCVQTVRLRAAVVDLFLSEPPVNHEGVDILRRLLKKDSACYRILVTGKLMEWDVTDDGIVDAFVSFHRCNRDRRSLLETALDDCLEHCRRGAARS